MYKFQGSFYELVVEDPTVPKGLNPYQLHSVDFQSGSSPPSPSVFTPPRYNTSQLPPFVKTFTEISSLPFQPPALPPDEDPENTTKVRTRRGPKVLLIPLQHNSNSLFAETHSRKRKEEKDPELVH